MNGSPIPTLADRLRRVETGRLYVRLALAQTSVGYAQTAEQRAKAMAEVDAIRAELVARGERVA